LSFPNQLPREAEIMKRKVYLAVLSVLCVTLLLVSCTNPVKKDISINISLIGEAANINYSKLSKTPANFEDNIVVNKYKVYLYQDGTVVYQQEFSNISNNTISLRLTNINSGTYTLKVEAFNDTTPIFYGEELVQLSYGQNNIQLTTYFNKARLTVDVENKIQEFDITQLRIVGSLPASPTNSFVENASFQNKEIYPGVWHIELEVTLTSDSSSIKVTYPTKAYEIYPSQDKVLGLVVKSDDVGNVYIDLQPPRVKIVSPTDGETLHGTVTILAEVQDSEGIAQVGFFVNYYGLLESFTSSPYEYAWNTYGIIDGTYTLNVRAINLSGIQNSKSINVKVNNGQKTFGGSGSDLANSIQQTADGGYIVAGDTTSFGAGGYNVYILKLNSDGNSAWQKTFGGSSDDAALSVQETTDGGYIVAGYTRFFGAGNDDVYIVKLNSDGSLAWQKTYGGIWNDEAYSIQQTTDGGYIVAGYTESFGSGGRNVYILKLNSDGSLVWQKTFGGSDYDEAYSVQQTTDGGYIVGGYTYSFGFDNCDVYVLKLNSDGSLAWQKTFGGNGYDYARSVKQTTDGGYIVAGYTESFGFGGYILKLNRDGSLSWQKTFGGSGSDWASSIQQTTDGGYIVAGYTESFGSGGRDVYIVKLNSDGSLAWQKAYGGSGSDWASSIQQTTDGGYIVAGTTYSFGNASYCDAYILKLDSNGELHPFE